MLPAKLRRHRDTNHPEYKDNDVSFLKRKLEALTKSQSLMLKSLKTDDKKTPPRPSTGCYRIAHAGKAHAVGESLIKPFALEMATGVLGEQAKKKLETIQLSNNTVKRRIQDLPVDVEKQLVSRLKHSFAFSL